MWAVALVAVLVPPGAVPPLAAPPAVGDGSARPAVAPALVAPDVPVVAAPARWYGLPALVTDGFGLTLAVSGFAGKAGGPFLLGAAGYALGAPINHLANRRYAAAAGSLLLRALASGAAVAIFIDRYPSEHCDGDVYRDQPCQHETALLLGGLVLAGAAIVDDVFLARAGPAAAHVTRAALAPGLVVTPKAGLVSLGGSF